MKLQLMAGSGTILGEYDLQNTTFKVSGHRLTNAEHISFKIIKAGKISDRLIIDGVDLGTLTLNSYTVSVEQPVLFPPGSLNFYINPEREIDAKKLEVQARRRSRSGGNARW